MNYLKAIIQNDEPLEKKNLVKLIKLGKKLKINIIKYQKELNLLNKPKTISKPKSKAIKKLSLQASYNKLDSIRSVYTKNSSIIINFNKNVTSKDINFFELHYKNLNKDIFDFKGHFKNAKPTKLIITNIDKISIGQYKYNTLRIVLSNKKNLKTKYIINKKQIIIKILDINKKEKRKKYTSIKKVNISKKLLLKKDKDFSYTIKDVYVKDNAIIINFKHRISKEYIKFFELHYKNLNKDIFDLKGKFKDAKPTKLSIQNIKRISVSQYKKNTLRITISNKKNVKTIYSINNKQIKIKILNLKQTRTAKQKVNVLPSLPIFNPKQKIIVIDAGHGGKDSGALGPHKRYEKVAVLKVTKYLYKELRDRNYRVYITRSTDRFIKVRNRTVLANKKHADIFISIHANAAHKSKVKTARGMETFFLSPARSARAKRVAAQENRTDIRKMNYSSKNTLLTILNQGKITASNKLAIDIQQNMLFSSRKLYKDVLDGGVREGPFWVLVGAQMPAVLIEIGYISHKEESRRLYSKVYQKKLAHGIANGVDAYFLKNP